MRDTGDCETGQDRTRMSLKLPLEAEAIGRAKAGAYYLDFQRNTCWDMFDEMAVENYTKKRPYSFVL